MGQRNMQFTRHINDLETDYRGLDYIHPEPHIFYGSNTNFHRPNIHPVLPAPGNASNLSVHHPPEHYDVPLFVEMTQYNSFQPQHPSMNLDLAVSASSNPYNRHMAPPSASRDFPVPLNHGANEQMPFSSARRIFGIPTDSYGRSYPHMDCARGTFKQKFAEGVPGVFRYHNALADSSSSVASARAWPVESDVMLMAAANFAPCDYRGSETSSNIENDSHTSSRNRSGSSSSHSVLSHNTTHTIQRGCVGQPFQLPGNPWLAIQLCNSCGDSDTTAWNLSPAVPFLQGSIDGGQVEAGIIGRQGHQINSTSRISARLLLPPFLQRQAPNTHHQLPPTPGRRGHSINFPPQATFSQSSSIIPFQRVVEARSRYIRPVPPTGFRLYRPHRRHDTYDMNARHHNRTHLRVLPEDGVAMLEVAGYHEVVDSIDQHRDMRLDIDHMSYEELLALGERIGNVTTSLSEEVIASHLKTRSYVSSSISSNLEEGAPEDEDFDFCVICQTGYNDQENVGILDCGHEYHMNCLKKWLLVKNTCPICKSTALKTERKEDD